MMHLVILVVGVKVTRIPHLHGLVNDLLVLYMFLVRLELDDYILTLLTLAQTIHVATTTMMTTMMMMKNLTLRNNLLLPMFHQWQQSKVKNRCSMPQTD
jgi:hypothetical protein